MKKPKIQIIALFGEQGSGKTTVANAIASSPRLPNDKKWKRRSFAQPIRDMLSALMPKHLLSPTEDKTAPIKALKGKNIRYTMQTLGTEWGRNMIGENIWIDALIQWASDNNVKRVVIDDLRMNNEFEFLKKRGAMIVKLVRDLPSKSDEHASEKDWKSWMPDFTVKNSFSANDCAEEIIEKAESFFL